MATETTTAQEPIIRLTQNAAMHIRSMQSDQPENAGKPLRVYVEGGGCSGMQYGMVFDEKREGDVAGDFFGVPIVIDPASVDYLRGTEIDYSDALTGGGFKIKNPQAKASCGCGKSFEA